MPRRRPSLPVAASRPSLCPGCPLPPRGVQGHRLGADGYNCPSARAIFVFIIIFPGRGPVVVPTAFSTYEDTVVAGLHLQVATVLNIHQLVNIVLDSSTNYASWRDLMA
jgi:hypothetical protein